MSISSPESLRSASVTHQCMMSRMKTAAGDNDDASGITCLTLSISTIPRSLGEKTGGNRMQVQFLPANGVVRCAHIVLVIPKDSSQVLDSAAESD